MYHNKKAQYFKDPNFGLLYNPFAYLYTYQKEDNLENLKNY